MYLAANASGHLSAPFRSGMDLAGWGGSGAKLCPHPEAIPCRFPLQMPRLFYFFPSGTTDDQGGIPLGAGTGFGQAAPPGRVHRAQWTLRWRVPLLGRRLLIVVGRLHFVPLPNATLFTPAALRRGDPFSRSPLERRARPEGKNPEEAIEGTGCHHPQPVRGGEAVFFFQRSCLKHTHRFYERGSGAAGNAARCFWSNLLPLGHESRPAGPHRRGGPGRAGCRRTPPGPRLACSHRSPRPAPKGCSPWMETPPRVPSAARVMRRKGRLGRRRCGRGGGDVRRVSAAAGGGAGRAERAERWPRRGGRRGGPGAAAASGSARLMSPVTLWSAAGAAGR